MGSGVIEANLKSVVDSVLEVLRSPDVHERATNYGKYFQQMRWSHTQEKALDVEITAPSAEHGNDHIRTVPRT